MSATVTIPKDLAQSLLDLLTRQCVEGLTSVPVSAVLASANALDRAMHAPRSADVAPGATPWLPVGQGVCRFCQSAPTPLGGLCTQCTDDLLRDAQELEARPCPRCHDA